MANSHEECYVLNEGDNTHVTLHPAEIALSLQDKLSQQDVEHGIDCIIKQQTYQHMIGNLYYQCNNVKCINKESCYFRSIPNGSTNAKVMFISKIPSRYEACGMCSHTDKGATLFTVMLDKMHLSRKDVYCTDMIKCHCNNLDEESFQNCINTYLEEEIAYVQPKVIIFNGMAAMKTMAKLGHITNLPEEITYGKIYDATVVKNNAAVKVIAVYDLDKVLQKTGNEVAECKLALWQHTLAAFKEAGVIPPAI